MLEIGAGADLSPEISVIRLRGSLDSSTSQDFRAFFSELIERNQRLFILEATGLVSISSAGISSLIDFAEGLRRSGGMAVFIGLNSEIRLLLDFSGISSRIRYTGSITEAEELLRRKSGDTRTNIEISDAGAVKNVPSTGGVSVRYREVTARPADELDIGKRGPQPPSQIYRIRREPERRGNTADEASAERRGTPFSGVLDNPEGEIILCEQCGAHLRVKRAGEHLCPSCKIRFLVKRDATASFYEKLEK
jgi:anti-anti-sigma factor